ncbi:TauD/TfdA family dioxygenase [Streptomyces tailanensis]|uniref:TauD/TfdA family dioxygenase n=1 Tax=Streptomyces tailanensis TaxID=2569858 RepID=UPI00122E6529|nr:TauD/TfdA family dioxygenase [Streptomyces tailanensis]
MSETGIPSPRSARRVRSRVHGDRLVTIATPDGPSGHPPVAAPSMAGVRLDAWAVANRATVEQHLRTSGALLFRGFEVREAAAFEQVLSSLYGDLVAEHERSSPRHRIAGNVYTSTDHPPDQPIFLHNEMSYATRWPLRLGFCCLTPPGGGGETPIASIREVTKSVPEAIRRRFAEKKIMYVRNYGRGYGLSWQESFQTDSRAEAEAYCRAACLTAEWEGVNRLRTRRVSEAMARHPETGEDLWFNHAVFFHISTLEPSLRAVMTEELSPHDLPTNSFYGDGTPIEPDILDTLRTAYQRAMVAFPWQQGDVLLLDNMLSAHGRAPFSGRRRVAVAMARPVWADQATA